VTRFQPLGETELHRGPVVSMYNLRIQTPDGSEIDRQVVRHPGAVAVVPLLADGETVVLVRQYRAALDTQLLEVPAGKLDVQNENLTVAAQRELVEEIGQRAGRFELLAHFLNSPGFTDERSWVFLARDLTETEDNRQGPEEEAMTIEHVRLDELDDLMASGELIDAKSLIGLLVARERLRAEAG
jgi:ADP-ribose pyrophosphatase